MSSSRNTSVLAAGRMLAAALLQRDTQVLRSPRWCQAWVFLCNPKQQAHRTSSRLGVWGPTSVTKARRLRRNPYLRKPSLHTNQLQLPVRVQRNPVIVVSARIQQICMPSLRSPPARASSLLVMPLNTSFSRQLYPSTNAISLCGCSSHLLCLSLRLANGVDGPDLPGQSS